MFMPDKAAIRCLKSGDIGGLESLIARYQVKAIRAAYFVIQDEQLAEDIVQDAFLSIYRHIQSFDENRPFEPYLMRSVVNVALNTARQHRKEISLDGKDNVQCLEALLSQAASLDNRVELAELTQTILAAIASLPVRQRAVIVQRYYLDMTEKEMATTLESTPGTVKWLLHAARTRLRDLLSRQRSA